MFRFPVWADETVLFQRPEVRSPPLVDDCHGEHTQIDWTNSNQLFWEWLLRADCRQAYIRCPFIGRRQVFSRTWHAPFISDPVDEGAALVRRMLNLCRERVDVLVDVLAFQDMCLYERYRFTGEFDGLLLGDGSHPCQPRLLTPYRDPEPGTQQNFNWAHCRTRAQVEMTVTSGVHGHFWIPLGRRHHVGDKTTAQSNSHLFFTLQCKTLILPLYYTVVLPLCTLFSKCVFPHWLNLNEIKRLPLKHFLL